MSIDFTAVIGALREIGYDGYLTLEADAYLSGRAADETFDGVRELYGAAKRLSDIFDVKTM